MRALRVLPLVLVAACFDPGNAPSCTIQCSTDADCTDGLTCGAGNLCTAGENCIEPETCTPNQFIACVDGDTARSCNATGDGTTDLGCDMHGCNMTERRCNACTPSRTECTTDNLSVEKCMPDGSAKMTIDQCTAGCVAELGTAEAHCTYLSPHWLEDICDAPAMKDSYMPNASATITTTLDTNCDAIVPQTGGAPICVVRAKSIVIPANVTLTHDGTRAIAYVADSLLEVRGILDASASGTQSGPGAGGANGVAGTNTTAGGGAGFGTAGAAGGSTATGGGGAAGPALDPFTLAAFVGGYRAKDGNGPLGGMDPIGGGGGGAVMLVACRGEVKMSGTVDVNGGGGRGSYDTVGGAQISLSDGAAGGGTGGYVVLQGLTVTVDGSIWANGGGGGGGNTANDSSGGAGADGQRSTSVAGGGSASGGGATGGAGGALNVAPRPGTGASTGNAAGGGGGAVGVIQIFTPAGVNPVTTGATTSPAFQPRKNATLR